MDRGRPRETVANPPPPKRHATSVAAAGDAHSHTRRPARHATEGNPSKNEACLHQAFAIVDRIMRVSADSHKRRRGARDATAQDTDADVQHAMSERFVAWRST